MYYKQFTSGHQLVAIGEAPNTTALPPYFIEISQEEYENLKEILSFGVSNQEPELTPLNNDHELILN